MTDAAPPSPALVSVVLPARDEAAGIEATLREVAGVLTDTVSAWEIVVVDDGSTDGTFDRVAAASGADPRVRGVRFSRGFGKEAALLAGLSEARGDVVVTMDADLQHPPALLPAMLQAWQDGARVVNAVKRRRANDPLATRFRAAVFNGVLSSAARIDLHGASDFKLLDRVVVDALVRDLPERTRFYRGLTQWVGFAQAYVEFDVAERRSGAARWSILGLVDLATTAVVSFTGAPLRIVTFLGFVTLLLAAGISADAFWSHLRGTSVSGFPTIIVTLLVIGSFVMISLGIVGEYVAKVYDELKRRPPYVVERRTQDPPGYTPPRP